MQELGKEELAFVSGGLACSEEFAANVYYGIQDTGSFGGDLINIYEGLVYATSHVIERVANAF